MNFNNVLLGQKTKVGVLQAASAIGSHAARDSWTTIAVLEVTNPYIPLKDSPPGTPDLSRSNSHSQITPIQPSMATKSAQPSYQTSASMNHGQRFGAPNSYGQPGPIPYLPVVGGGLDPELSGQKPPEMDFPHRYRCVYLHFPPSPTRFES